MESRPPAIGFAFVTLPLRPSPLLRAALPATVTAVADGAPSRWSVPCSAATRGQFVRVYIDGFNFYYAACVDGTFGRRKWLDLVAFARCLVSSHHVDHVRYFTAQLKPTPRSPRARIRQGICLNAMRAQPRLSVHLGTFSKHPMQMPLAPPPTAGCEDGVVYLA